MKAIVTVVGPDRVGIIAKVSTYLAENDVNIQDISQTIMQDYFTMIMVVDTAGCTVSWGDLKTGAEKLGNELGLEIRFQQHQLFDSMHRV